MAKIKIIHTLNNDYNIYDAAALHDLDSVLDTNSSNPVANKAVTSALNNKSDVGHTHDEGYYTESEMDALLAAAQTIPAGTICLWHGSSDTIPANWALCNGENGTPDLRDRFVVGAGNSYSVGTTGGTATESLTWSQETSGTIYEGNYGYSTATHDNRPPYYALCYIMKL